MNRFAQALERDESPLSPVLEAIRREEEPHSFIPTSPQISPFSAQLFEQCAASSFENLFAFDLINLATMDGVGRGDVCEHCHETDYCSYCLPWSTNHRYDSVKPGCFVCRNSFQTRIDALRAESAKQKEVYEAKLAFLMLQDPAPASETLKGDVALVVQGSEQKIHSHRFILANKSSVFGKMFEADMMEKHSGVIRIDDATFPVMRSVIGFCYTADIQFTDEVPAEEVLKVAHKYAIDHLRDVCAEHLTKTINKDSLPQMLRLSKKFEAKALQDAAAKYFKDNFDTAFPNVLNEL